jgi:tRNA-splicing ligase RtcB
MIFGTHQENTLAQFEKVRVSAVKAALMADGHLGYVMPVGGVAAYRNQISIMGVGVDIACGNAAIKTDIRLGFPAGMGPLHLQSREARKEWGDYADAIQDAISFGVGRTNRADDAPVDHPLFESDAWSLLPKEANAHNLKGKARSQLGTVGSGNHYVDVFVDEEGFIWVGVHFGSRGLGHTIATGFHALSLGLEWGARAPESEVLVDLDTPLGHDYWHLMQLAGEYAYAGREWVARKVVEILGGKEVELIHNHHNFAWKEPHPVDGDTPEVLVVVRKGATPAWPGQKGFIGGSMGDDAVIVAGAEPSIVLPSKNESRRAATWDQTWEAQAGALWSTVHGAGRVMSRTEAAGKRNRRTGEQKSPGKVSPEMMNSWMQERGTILRGGGLDESPHAYRRLKDVIAAQGDTINVLHTLRPLIVVMAGANEYDPYKD